MIVFSPIWLTPPGSLGTVTQGNSVVTNLSAALTASFMASDGQNTVPLSLAANSVTNVYVNAESLSADQYSGAGNTLLLANALSSRDVVSLTAGGSLTYTLLHDSLPPGLSMSASGHISGVVGTIPSSGNAVTYGFAVRVSGAGRVRDQQFSYSALPVFTPPTWGTAFPSEVYDSTLTCRYIPLGVAQRGSPFSYALDIDKPDAQPIGFSIQPISGYTGNETLNGALPPGLSLNASDFTISGTCSTYATPGKYVFALELLDENGDTFPAGSTSAQTKRFEIEVATPFQTVVPLTFVTWVTSSGLLCAVNEAEPFSMSVNATCTTGEVVTYALVDSTTLPSGLTLNTKTGEITGITGHVSADTSYSFTVRASVSEAFADRTFAIKVLNRYTSETVLNVGFKLGSTDALPLSAYYSTYIRTNEVFRPDDENFGLPSTLSIYLVGGLEGDIGALANAVASSGFGGPVTAVLGPAKVAQVQINGADAYEVIYREVFDPEADAGGFVLSGGVESPESLIYPESSPTNPLYLYPTSLANLRYDLINRVGFPSADPSLTQVAGLTGVENLPPWMRSAQANGSALGFTPAIVVAYVKPGIGQTVLDRLAVATAQPSPTLISAPNPLVNGHVLKFDQYYVVYSTTSVSTLFDDGQTIFDDGAMIFDSFSYQQGKYLRIKPQKLGSAL